MTNITGNVHKAYSREVPRSGVLPTVSGWAALCFQPSCSPENLMHPHLYKSNQISYPRGCFTKRDILRFPLDEDNQCKSIFNGNEYIKVAYLVRKYMIIEVLSCS